MCWGGGICGLQAGGGWLGTLRWYGRAVGDNIAKVVSWLPCCVVGGVFLIV